MPIYLILHTAVQVHAVAILSGIILLVLLVKAVKALPDWTLQWEEIREYGRLSRATRRGIALLDAIDFALLRPGAEIPNEQAVRETVWRLRDRLVDSLRRNDWPAPRRRKRTSARIRIRQFALRVRDRVLALRR